MAESIEMTTSTPSERELRVVRAFAAPRGLVWEAWTSPARLPHWMLGPDRWTMPVCELDLRPGGAWHYGWRRTDDGTEMDMRGVHREVKAPERLVSTESWGGDWPETVNTLELQEESGHTVMTMTIAYPSLPARDAAMGTGMLQGVARSFERLDDLLRTMQAGGTVRGARGS